MGYSRLEESERRLFGIPVKDMVDFPLVAGAYRYNESVIVVYGTGVHRCLEVWGNDDRTTTVGMVAGTSTPPHTWLSPTSPTNERFQFDLFPCSVVLYDWTSLDKSPPFVRWSSLFTGVPSGALRYDVARVVIQPKAGSFLLYAPGMVSPRSSFRSIQGPASADHTGLTGLTGLQTTSNPAASNAPGSGPVGSSGPDLVVIGVSVGAGLAVLLIIAMFVAVAKRRRS
jgi:hypothetical protein